MKMFLNITCILMFLACKDERIEINNLNGNRIIALGHGGMGISYSLPMNSFESLSMALKKGADGVEIDVQMTKDSVLIAFHDELLSEHTHQSGFVYEKTWKELEGIVFKEPIMSAYKVIRLQTFFEGHTANQDKVYAFDCKNFNPDSSEAYLKRFSNALLKLINAYRLSNVIVELKREDLIETLRRLSPELQIYIYTDFENGMTMCRKHKLQGIVLDVDDVSAEQVKQAHNEGFMITVLNAHTNKKNKEAIAKHVDIIETDNLKNLLKLLR